MLQQQDNDVGVAALRRERDGGGVPGTRLVDVELGARQQLLADLREAFPRSDVQSRPPELKKRRRNLSE